MKHYKMKNGLLIEADAVRLPRKRKKKLKKYLQKYLLIPFGAEIQKIDRFTIYTNPIISCTHTK